MSDSTPANTDPGVHWQEQALGIQSRGDFIALVRELACDWRRNPDGWENRDLGAYLDALAAWVEDMEGYYQNRGEATPETPDWKTVGQMLLAARVYE